MSYATSGSTTTSAVAFVLEVHMEKEAQQTLAFELAMIRQALFSDVNDEELERATHPKCTNGGPRKA